MISFYNINQTLRLLENFQPYTRAKKPGCFLSLVGENYFKPLVIRPWYRIDKITNRTKIYAISNYKSIILIITSIIVLRII